MVKLGLRYVLVFFEAGLYVRLQAFGAHGIGSQGVAAKGLLLKFKQAGI